MQLIPYDAEDTASVLAGLSVLDASRAAETPWMPRLTPYRRTMQVRHGWDGTPVLHVLGCDDGVPVAVAALEQGQWDNRDLGWLDYLIVHPSHRRRGHGTAMLAHLTELARERGCTKTGGCGWDLPATWAFTERHGFTCGSQSVRRVVRPRDLPAGLVEGLYAEAAARAKDYELVRIEGPVPESLLPAVAELTAAINDAPVDDLDIEDEEFPVERIRGYEHAQVEGGHRLYRVLARHRGSGELAGHTVVAVDAETPAEAHQHDTAVTRAHRGHRLGLLLKADMMRWLADAEPEVEALSTWNAESNDHMISVNERLGYVATGREVEFQRPL